MNKRSSYFVKRSGRSAGGFTLVEMLVVMGIVAILAAASVTAFRSVGTALGLSTAAQQITSEITTARQSALTFSETVEVRFYYYTDSFTGASQYQSMQTFSTTDGVNFTQMDRISYLPPSIMISTSTTYSSPFADNTLSPLLTPDTTKGALAIPGTVGTNYKYKVLRFKPGGSIDYITPTTAPTSWFITIFEKKYASSSASAIKNFITINVDSTSGRIRMFQP